MIRAFPSFLTRRFFLALTARWERAGFGQFMRTDSRPALGCAIYPRLARHRLHLLVRSCVVSHPEKREGSWLIDQDSSASVGMTPMLRLETSGGSNAKEKRT